MKEIEAFLKENKPLVKDDPTFLQETRRRMDQVDGIKAEVDRQRSYGRIALIVALAIGLAAGVLITALAYLYPVDVQSVRHGLWESVRVFAQTWRQYLLLPIAVIAIGLGVVLSRKTVRQ